jgi:RNA polymerase primary sigma factor
MYLEGIRKYRLLSAREEIKCTKKAGSGDENAKNRLITSNLGLVISIAKKYTGSGMPLLDLIQEGSLGLMWAINKFNPRKKFRLSTYATYWIKQTIRRSIDEKQRTIRLPVYIIEKINKINKTIEILRQELGRHPTEEEIARRSGIPKDKVKDLLALSKTPLSLETPIGGDDDIRIGIRIGDNLKDTTPPVDKTVLRRLLLGKDLKEVLSSLPAREKTVIELLFGLNDGQPKTLEEVGILLNIPQEKICQIEAKAIRKLRYPIRSKKLINYL